MFNLIPPPGSWTALGAAALFGASTPLAQQLAGDIPPIFLAGLLYLGSGIGLLIVRLVRDRGWKVSGLSKREWPWLLGSILFGGMMGPSLLMFALSQVSGASASLLLNLEAVFTALIAWLVFKENTDRRIMFGMLLIVLGGIALSWPQAQISIASTTGPLLIAAACFCWAIDNNLTRKVSASDAVFIASVKGLIAGSVNVTLAMAFGNVLFTWSVAGPALLVGFLGYGVSFVLFVLALRALGTARTGAYFSIAPFVGATVAIVVFHEETSSLFWLATVLMAAGVWLHLTEHHEHNHTHEPLLHGHTHVHDEHHQHEHQFAWDGVEPHEHPHQHALVTHVHPHFPDIHHRHKHNQSE